MKIALVSSIGGHLTELVELVESLTDHELVWIVNDVSPVLPRDVRAYRVAHAERDLLVAWNVVEFAAIFSRERPDVVMSTGAGPAVCAAIVARMAGIPFVHVEPASAVRRLSLTGKLMRRLATSFFVQWRELADEAGARYEGGLL